MHLDVLSRVSVARNSCLIRISMSSAVKWSDINGPSLLPSGSILYVCFTVSRPQQYSCREFYSVVMYFRCHTTPHCTTLDMDTGRGRFEGVPIRDSLVMVYCAHILHIVCIIINHHQLQIESSPIVLKNIS